MLFPVSVSHITYSDGRHLDLDPLQIPVIAHGMTVVSFAHDVSMLQTMRATTSASSLLNNPEVVVTVETLKHGGYRSVVRTTLQRKAQVKPQRLSLATLPIFQTLNQSRTKRSQGSYRRRCVRRWLTPSTSSWTLLTTHPMNHPSRPAKQISGSSLLPIL